MEETAFFESGDVRVTNARFVVGAQTYAMSGVTSVKTGVQPRKLAGPIITIILGVLLLGASPPAGVVIAGAGILWLVLTKTVYTVVLSSSSGETQALSGTDRDHIESVVTALNNAIIHRG